ATGPWEFHTEKWELGYIKRIDATIAALKSAGVPVFWVGLPSQRGTKASADSSYLNEIYRSRAEKAGIVYVDIWDGFVDEAGRYPRAARAGVRRTDPAVAHRRRRLFHQVRCPQARPLRRARGRAQHREPRCAGRPPGAGRSGTAGGETGRTGAAAGSRTGRAVDGRQRVARGARRRRPRRAPRCGSGGRSD